MYAQHLLCAMGWHVPYKLHSFPFHGAYIWKKAGLSIIASEFFTNCSWPKRFACLSTLFRIANLNFLQVLLYFFRAFFATYFIFIQAMFHVAKLGSNYIIEDNLTLPPCAGAYTQGFVHSTSWAHIYIPGPHLLFYMLIKILCQKGIVSVCVCVYLLMYHERCIV